MAHQATRKLVDFLQDKAGESLRVVFHYDDYRDEHEIMYMREDIKDDYTPSELEDHFDTFRRDSHLAAVQESKLRTGKHHCSIRVYDETLIFNFTLGHRYNTIVSMDPMVGRDLLSFVSESIEQLGSESTELDWEPPRWV